MCESKHAIKTNRYIELLEQQEQKYRALEKL